METKPQRNFTFNFYKEKNLKILTIFFSRTTSVIGLGFLLGFFLPDVNAQYNSPIVAWKDTCPICDMKAINWCKCLINERTCENGHTWYWWNSQKIVGSKHNNTNSIDYLRSMWKEVDSLKQQPKT